MAHESQQSKPGGGTLISNHGFCYPDLNPMNSYEANPELFTLQTGMEMLGLPPSKPRAAEQHQQRNQFTWKGFTTTNTTAKQETSRGNTTMDQTNHYYFSEPTSNDNLMVAPETGWSDPTSLQCVFNDRPSQGLSLRPPDVGFYASSSSPSMLCFSEAAAVAPQLPPSHHVQMRNSKYLVPAQELLNEFCSLGNGGDGGATKNKSRKTHQSDDGDSSRNQSLYSMDLLELQKRKARLLTMLEEVDGRYRHYCEQMKAVVSTFEAVAGEGTARVYSSLASKAMSRHFRCLRDGIVGQIKATDKAMREKDVVVPGASKGETPRLRVLDQTIRQQKAFQQMGLMESHPWRPQRGLPERSVSVLRAWLFEHFLHPYPSDVDKHILARQTGLSRSQVSNWFINARVRLWKPMVEEMYMEETKEQDILLGRLENNENNNNDDDDDSRPNHHHLLHNNQNPSSPTRNSERKPITNHGLLLHDPDSLSSIITSTHNNNNDRHNQFMRGAPEAFGVVDVDFSSYNNNGNKNNSDNNLHHHHNFGGGVSLTLGLQQHGSGGMSLSFSPTTQQSLFFSRESVDVHDCQPVQFSILDGEGSNLPYRNLMGTQLLHDLAG